MIKSCKGRLHTHTHTHTHSHSPWISWSYLDELSQSPFEPRETCKEVVSRYSSVGSKLVPIKLRSFYLLTIETHFLIELISQKRIRRGMRKTANKILFSETSSSLIKRMQKYQRQMNEICVDFKYPV